MNHAAAAFMLYPRPHRRWIDRPALFYSLATLPIVDCIVDQLNNALHLTLGPVSLLQIVHGSLVLVFAALCLLAALEDRAAIQRIPLPVLAAFLLIAVALTKELVVTGTLAMSSVGAYGQMSYWLLFWTAVAMTADAPWKAQTLLRGFALGALATAASVFLGFAFGAENFYKGDAVASSAGWFDTAKMVTGVLVTGGIVLLYLGRKAQSWFYPVLACICFAACILTYARAGSVALAAVLLWLPLWTVSFARRGNRRWIVRFLLLAVLGGLAGVAIMGPAKLFARWGDVKQGDQAGSGRATFWKMASDRFLDATPAQQALGRGYNAMSEMLFTDYGMDIKHTHNDMLDMLSVGGLAGGLWLLFFVGFQFARVLRNDLSSAEGGAAMAILLGYLLHGQFTGQLWGTDAMSHYTVSLACLAILSPRHAEHPADLPLVTAAHSHGRAAHA